MLYQPFQASTLEKCIKGKISVKLANSNKNNILIGCDSLSKDLEAFHDAYKSGMRFVDPNNVKVLEKNTGGLIRGFTGQYAIDKEVITLNDGTKLTKEEAEIFFNGLGYLAMQRNLKG